MMKDSIDAALADRISLNSTNLEVEASRAHPVEENNIGYDGCTSTTATSE